MRERNGSVWHFLVRSFLVKAVDFDLRAFCFRWVKVFGTIFGEERYCEAFLGDYEQVKKGGKEERRLALPYTWGSGIGMTLDRGTKISGKELSCFWRRIGTEMRSCVLGHDNGVFIVLSFCDSDLYVVVGTTKLNRHWEKVGR